VFDQNSRYARLENLEYEDPDGRKIKYRERRCLPQGRSLPLLQDVDLAPSDRLDLIAARILGDPLLFWRICDANNCMNPFDLTGEDALKFRRRLRAPSIDFEVGS
jgi:hypothetical protein